MIPLVIIRHGPTDWNVEKRIQGRSDLPLSDLGRQQVAKWVLPIEFQDYRWVSSPLGRALETARLLGGEPEIEQRLIEMFWGSWEGQRFPMLRDDLGEEMKRNQARGLDFRPDGGESPREVQARLAPWLEEILDPTVAVCHKGVLNALYALASGWDMLDKPADKLRDACAHLFHVVMGSPQIERLNIPLVTE